MTHRLPIHGAFTGSVAIVLEDQTELELPPR